MRLLASKLMLKKRWYIRQIEENTPYYDIKYYDNTFYIAGKNCIVKGSTPDNLESMSVVPSGMNTVIWKKISHKRSLLSSFSVIVGENTTYNTGVIVGFNGLPSENIPDPFCIETVYYMFNSCCFFSVANRFVLAGFYKDTTYTKPAIAGLDFSNNGIHIGTSATTNLGNYNGHLTDVQCTENICRLVGQSENENYVGFTAVADYDLDAFGIINSLGTEINSMTSDSKLLAGEDACYYSSNLSTWQSVIGNSFGAWKGAYYNGTNYYLCGENGYFAYSNNGANWVVEKVGNNTWNSVIRAGQYIVLVGDNGYLAYTVIS